jgi:hypothetical protein
MNEWIEEFLEQDVITRFGLDVILGSWIAG